MTEIELFNLDAEKHEVALVYSDKLCRCEKNVKQINGRLIVVSFDTAPARTNVIAAYAPHAGRSMKDKDFFYQDLQADVNSLPKHEINIILGDFNARLAERLPHEHDIVGPHIFRQPDSSIDRLSSKQLDNRIRFVSFCQEHGFIVCNTWFQKELSKLVTCRNVATPAFQSPFTDDRYAQLDYCLINRPWKNCVRNV